MKRYPSLPLLLATLILIPTINALQITEVMYTPSDANEWVEIYNNDSNSFNIATLQLKDSSSTDTIECCTSPCNASIEPNTFVLIVDKDSTLPLLQTNASHIFCVDDNSIGNGLSNTADTITIQIMQGANVQPLDTMSYGQPIISNSGFTLERTLQEDFTQGFDEGGTPLLPNSVWDFTRAYRGLVINEVLPDPDGSDTAEQPNGEWIEVYNGANHEIDLRDLTLQDADANNLPITSSNTFGSGVIICPNCYSVIYRNGNIQFSLGNQQDTILLSVNNQLLDSFTYSESTSGLSWSRIITYDEENNEISSFAQLYPSPKNQNPAEFTCDYSISLDTPILIEDPQNYTFEFGFNLEEGHPRVVNFTGYLSDVDGNIIQEIDLNPTEPIYDQSEYFFSPTVNPGFYIINLTVTPNCQDTNPQNNNLQQLIDILDPENIGEDVGGFEYWDIVDIVPSTANAGDVVAVRVMGEVNEESRFWLWVNDDQGKLTSDIDFTIDTGPFDITLPLDLKDICNRGGPAFVVMEGRGNHLETEFTITPTNCPPSSTSKSSTTSCHKSSKSYSFKEKIVQGLQGPIVVESQSTFETTLAFDAPKGDYDVWAYVYRGSTCYSCAQKSINPEEHTYPLRSEGNTAIKLTIPITLDDMEPGDYQIKAKALKKGNKTPREFRAPLHVTSNTQSTKNSTQNTHASTNQISQDPPVSKSKILPTTQHVGPGIIMYQKDQSTPSEVITFFLALAFAVFLATIIYSKSS